MYTAIFVPLAAFVVSVIVFSTRSVSSFLGGIPTPLSEMRRTMSESSSHPVRTIVPVLSEVSRMP